MRLPQAPLLPSVVIDEDVDYDTGAGGLDG